MRKWSVTILSLIGSALLTRFIPFSSYFRNLDTMVHEFGHAAVTLLLSGHVLYIDLNADHSGLTYSAIGSGWAMVPVSLAGYMTASLFAVFLFHTNRKGNQQFGLGMATFIAVASLLLFVRNSFGITWLIVFIVVNVLAMLLAGRRIRKLYYLLLAFLTLEESVFGPLQLFILSISKPDQSGDAANLSHYTVLPAPVWSLLFLLFSLWCARWSISLFFSKKGD